MIFIDRQVNTMDRHDGPYWHSCTHLGNLNIRSRRQPTRSTGQRHYVAASFMARTSLGFLQGRQAGRQGLHGVWWFEPLDSHCTYPLNSSLDMGTRTTDRSQVRLCREDDRARDQLTVMDLLRRRMEGCNHGDGESTGIVGRKAETEPLTGRDRDACEVANSIYKWRDGATDQPQLTTRTTSTTNGKLWTDRGWVGGGRVGWKAVVQLGGRLGVKRQPLALMLLHDRHHECTNVWWILTCIGTVTDKKLKHRYLDAGWTWYMTISAIITSIHILKYNGISVIQLLTYLLN